SIRKPSATERTPGTRSVTTLTPESSVVMRCADSPAGRARVLRSVALAAMPRAARPALAFAPASAWPAVAIAGASVRGRPAVAPPAAATAGADARQLLDRLARDVR